MTYIHLLLINYLLQSLENKSTGYLSQPVHDLETILKRPETRMVNYENRG